MCSSSPKIYILRKCFNLRSTDGSQYIDTKYHLLEYIMKYEVQLKFTKSHDQIVKTFTKSLKFKDFRKLRMLFLQIKLMGGC